MAKEFKEILKEAKKDNVESKLIVADKYESDGKYKDAFKWYLEAANDGKIEAQLKVADYYFDGVYAKKDHTEACFWYSKAADGGNIEAMTKLADLYKDGFVVEKDLECKVINGEVTVLDMVVFTGEHDALFDEYFATMGIEKPKTNRINGYTSCYNYYTDITEGIIIRDLEALKAAPKAVKEFIDGILERFKKQEKSIMYEPIPAPKTQPQERGQRSKNRNYER